jgi:fluoride ion exporter CrcB/FEX
MAECPTPDSGEVNDLDDTESTMESTVESTVAANKRPSLVKMIVGFMVFGEYHTAEDVPFGVQLTTNYSFVCFFAMLGVGTRIYVGILFHRILHVTVVTASAALASDSLAAATMFYDLPANMLGCLLMGLAVGSQHWLLKGFPALYTGITTGFCGSLTTFSGWILKAALLCYEGMVAHAVVCIVVGYCTSESLLSLGKSCAWWMVPPPAKATQGLLKRLDEVGLDESGGSASNSLAEQLAVLQRKIQRVQAELQTEHTREEREESGGQRGRISYAVTSSLPSSHWVHRVYNTYKLSFGICVCVLAVGLSIGLFLFFLPELDSSGKGDATTVLVSRRQV